MTVKLNKRGPIVKQGVVNLAAPIVLNCGLMKKCRMQYLIFLYYFKGIKTTQIIYKKGDHSDI